MPVGSPCEELGPRPDVQSGCAPAHGVGFLKTIGGGGGGRGGRRGRGRTPRGAGGGGRRL